MTAINARFGDEGPSYLSGLGVNIKPLITAKEIAEKVMPFMIAKKKTVEFDNKDQFYQMCHEFVTMFQGLQNYQLDRYTTDRINELASQWSMKWDIDLRVKILYDYKLGSVKVMGRRIPIPLYCEVYLVPFKRGVLRWKSLAYSKD